MTGQVKAGHSAGLPRKRLDCGWLVTGVLWAAGRCRVKERKISVQAGAAVPGQGAVDQIGCVAASGGGHYVKRNLQVQTFVKTAFTKLLR